MRSRSRRRPFLFSRRLNRTLQVTLSVRPSQKFFFCHFVTLKIMISCKNHFEMCEPLFHVFLVWFQHPCYMLLFEYSGARDAVLINLILSYLFTFFVCHLFSLLTFCLFLECETPREKPRIKTLSRC